MCCVKFNPSSSYHLAYGSADHCVHYYDLRNPKAPLALFKGHRKAVSYVKFVDATSVVSASTDSQLKLWDLTGEHSGGAACVRSFQVRTITFDKKRLLLIKLFNSGPHKREELCRPGH